jgi:3-deoxy-D-arabino-heptulosonate 7-phosphate (DAHP) synthase class II
MIETIEDLKAKMVPLGFVMEAETIIHNWNSEQLVYLNVTEDDYKSLLERVNEIVGFWTAYGEDDEDDVIQETALDEWYDKLIT